jgi:hypothetical protein
MVNGLAGGLRTTSDALSSYRRDERARDQRWSAAEAARQPPTAPLRGPNASTGNQHEGY